MAEIEVRDQGADGADREADSRAEGCAGRDGDDGQRLHAGHGDEQHSSRPRRHRPEPRPARSPSPSRCRTPARRTGRGRGPPPRAGAKGGVLRRQCRPRAGGEGQRGNASSATLGMDGLPCRGCDDPVGDFRREDEVVGDDERGALLGLRTESAAAARASARGPCRGSARRGRAGRARSRAPRQPERSRSPLDRSRGCRASKPARPTSARARRARSRSPRRRARPHRPPSRRRRSGRILAQVRRTPAAEASPSDGSSSPAASLASVVFPEPFGPSSATISPRPSSRSGTRQAVAVGMRGATELAENSPAGAVDKPARAPETPDAHAPASPEPRLVAHRSRSSRPP